MFLDERERAETVWACRFCPMCAAGDRLASIVGRESYAPRGRGAILFALDRGMLPLDATVADIMYTTLNDGLLREWCVGNYDHEELVLDARRALWTKGLAPEPIAQHLAAVRARLGRPSMTAALLREHGVTVAERADVLLFAGCAGHGGDPAVDAGERPHAAATLVTAGRLFNAAGVGFAVPGTVVSCGWPFYQGGDLGGARECAVALSTAVRESGASVVATLDADCLRMFTTRTARFGGDLRGVRAMSITSLLDDWLVRGLLAVRARLDDAVTYHDPCSLARYCDETETPRRVLVRILQRPVVEMESHGKRANCCGAGGLLPMHRPDLALEVARRRLDEARATGAALVATACTGCDGMLGRASERTTSVPRVVSIVTLVAQAAGIEPAPA